MSLHFCFFLLLEERWSEATLAPCPSRLCESGPDPVLPHNNNNDNNNKYFLRPYSVLAYVNSLTPNRPLRKYYSHFPDEDVKVQQLWGIAPGQHKARHILSALLPQRICLRKQETGCLRSHGKQQNWTAKSWLFKAKAHAAFCHPDLAEDIPSSSFYLPPLPILSKRV